MRKNECKHLRNFEAPHGAQQNAVQSNRLFIYTMLKCFWGRRQGIHTLWCVLITSLKMLEPSMEMRIKWVAVCFGFLRCYYCNGPAHVRNFIFLFSILNCCINFGNQRLFKSILYSIFAWQRCFEYQDHTFRYTRLSYIFFFVCLTIAQPNKLSCMLICLTADWDVFCQVVVYSSHKSIYTHIRRNARTHAPT